MVDDLRRENRHSDVRRLPRAVRNRSVLDVFLKCHTPPRRGIRRVWMRSSCQRNQLSNQSVPPLLHRASRRGGVQAFVEDGACPTLSRSTQSRPRERWRGGCSCSCQSSAFLSKEGGGGAGAGRQGGSARTGEEPTWWPHGAAHGRNGVGGGGANEENEWGAPGAGRPGGSARRRPGCTRTPP